MAWEGSHSHGFPPKVRARILRLHPSCQCPGCKHHDGRCRRPSTDADHILPVAEGGTSTLANGQGLCRDCHVAKTTAEATRARARRRAARFRTPEPHPGIVA